MAYINLPHPRGQCNVANSSKRGKGGKIGLLVCRLSNGETELYCYTRSKTSADKEAGQLRHPNSCKGRMEKSIDTGSLATLPPGYITRLGGRRFGRCLRTTRTTTWLLGRRCQSWKRASRRGRSGRHKTDFRNKNPFTRGLNDHRDSSGSFNLVVCLPIVFAGDLGVSPFPASKRNSSGGAQSLETAGLVAGSHLGVFVPLGERVE
jgi:hypothetical protein